MVGEEQAVERSTWNVLLKNGRMESGKNPKNPGKWRNLFRPTGQIGSGDLLEN